MIFGRRLQPGPGKMTDWRDIVALIKDYAAKHR